MASLKRTAFPQATCCLRMNDVDYGTNIRHDPMELNTRIMLSYGHGQATGIEIIFRLHRHGATDCNPYQVRDRCMKFHIPGESIINESLQFTRVDDFKEIDPVFKKGSTIRESDQEHFELFLLDFTAKELWSLDENSDNLLSLKNPALKGKVEEFRAAVFSARPLRFHCLMRAIGEVNLPREFREFRKHLVVDARKLMQDKVLRVAETGTGLGGKLALAPLPKLKVSPSHFLQDQLQETTSVTASNVRAGKSGLVAEEQNLEQGKNMTKDIAPIPRLKLSPSQNLQIQLQGITTTAALNLPIGEFSNFTKEQALSQGTNTTEEIAPIPRLKISHSQNQMQGITIASASKPKAAAGLGPVAEEQKLDQGKNTMKDMVPVSRLKLSPSQYLRSQLNEIDTTSTEKEGGTKEKPIVPFSQFKPSSSQYLRSQLHEIDTMATAKEGAAKEKSIVPLRRFKASPSQYLRSQLNEIDTMATAKEGAAQPRLPSTKERSIVPVGRLKFSPSQYLQSHLRGINAATTAKEGLTDFQPATLKGNIEEELTGTGMVEAMERVPRKLKKLPSQSLDTYLGNTKTKDTTKLRPPNPHIVTASSVIKPGFDEQKPLNTVQAPIFTKRSDSPTRQLIQPSNATRLSQARGHKWEDFDDSHFSTTKDSPIDDSPIDDSPTDFQRPPSQVRPTSTISIDRPRPLRTNSNKTREIQDAIAEASRAMSVLDSKSRQPVSQPNSYPEAHQRVSPPISSLELQQLLLSPRSASASSFEVKQPSQRFKLNHYMVTPVGFNPSRPDLPVYGTPFTVQPPFAAFESSFEESKRQSSSSRNSHKSV